MEYCKINTLFMRDENNVIIPEEYTEDIFGALENCLWECTEKIDGTNMRVELVKEADGWKMAFGGRTDRAVIPPLLLARMHELFDGVDWDEVFPAINTDVPVTIYGEGYGTKIQGCGSRYIPDGVDFILFDVKVGNLWLQRCACEDIAEEIHVSIVPFIDYMTIPDAIKFVRKGFTSTISADKTLPAEGLVLKAPGGILDRRGRRIITKIKTKDFLDWERKSKS